MIRILFSLLVSAAAAASPVGVNFALALQVNKLDPDVAASKAFEAGFTKAKIFSVDLTYVRALRDAGFKEVVVAVPNYLMDGAATWQSKATEVAGQLKPFVIDGLKVVVVVGNEPLAPWYGGRYNGMLADRVETMQNALDAAGLTKVPVTVPFYFGIMGRSYPPYEGRFKQDVSSILSDVSNLFLTRAIANDFEGIFMANMYPYFDIIGNQAKDINIAYAVGNQGINAGGVAYPNLLSADFGACRAALDNLDERFQDLKLVVGETGWPTAGGDDFGFSTVENAQAFVTNTVEWAEANNHEIYLFEAFDEQGKAAAGTGGGNNPVENHFGLFTEAGVGKFSLSIEDSGATLPPVPGTDNGCTPLGNDPWSSGSKLPCCDALEEKLAFWDGPDGQNYYRCVQPEPPTAPSTPPTAPSTPPTAPSAPPTAPPSTPPTAPSAPPSTGLPSDDEATPDKGNPVTAPSAPPVASPVALAPSINGNDGTDQGDDSGQRCTPDGSDPWSSGSNLPCCDALEERLAQWDGPNGRNYYRCVELAGSEVELGEGVASALTPCAWLSIATVSAMSLQGYYAQQ